LAGIISCFFTKIINNLIEDLTLYRIKNITIVVDYYGFKIRKL
jgi:hypothetical protein